MVKIYIYMHYYTIYSRLINKKFLNKIMSCCKDSRVCYESEIVTLKTSKDTKLVNENNAMFI